VTDDFPRQGEIYLVRIPNQPKDLKNRPAVIVSLDIRNRLAEDVTVIPLSTTLRLAPTHVLLHKGEGGLKHESMAKCEQITTLDKSLLVRGPFAGRLTRARIEEIRSAVLRSLGDPV
jgi:mRNA interferase MazF